MCAVLHNLSVKQKDSICTFVTINREFQNGRLGTRGRIHRGSQTNKGNLLREWRHGGAQTLLGPGIFQSGPAFASFGRTS